jgi:hypothetical protein
MTSPSVEQLQHWMEGKEDEHLEFKEAKNNFHFEMKGGTGQPNRSKDGEAERKVLGRLFGHQRCEAVLQHIDVLDDAGDHIRIEGQRAFELLGGRF